MKLLPLVSDFATTSYKSLTLKSSRQLFVVALLSIGILSACGGGSGDSSDDDDETEGLVLTLNAGADGSETVELGEGRIYRELDATATSDGESVEVTIDSSALNLSETGTADTIGAYEVIYSATDSAGNSSEVTRTVNVVERRPFITTWNATADEDTGEIAIVIAGNPDLVDDYLDLDDRYNYRIDCGDGATVEGWQDANEASLNLTDDGDFECIYTTEGIKTIKISDILADGSDGVFGQMYYFLNDDREKLLTIEQWGDIKLLNLKYAFYYCDSLDVDAIDTPDLRLVTSAQAAFMPANSFNASIAGWDVSSIENMRSMFSNATSFNEDISGWDVSSVTNMKFMFSAVTSFNQDISAWDVSSVTNMNSMFDYATAFDQNLASWQVQSVTNMLRMFSGVTLSTSNYDAILNGWSAQDVQENLTFSVGDSVRSSASDDAVAILEGKGWTISSD